MWCGRQSCYLQCQHPIWLLESWLLHFKSSSPANVPGKAKKNGTFLSSCTHVGDPNEVPGFRLTHLMSEAAEERSILIYSLSFPPFLSLPFSLPPSCSLPFYLPPSFPLCSCNYVNVLNHNTTHWKGRKGEMGSKDTETESWQACSSECTADGPLPFSHKPAESAVVMCMCVFLAIG